MSDRKPAYPRFGGDVLGAGDPGALERLFPGWSGPPGGDGPGRPASAEPDPAALALLRQAYRDRGHLAAAVDPLAEGPPAAVPDLDPSHHGLDPAAVAEVTARLRRTWCGPIGYEIAQVNDPARRRWLTEQAEAASVGALDDTGRLAALTLLARAEAFESFMRARFPGAKTFGLSGIEGYLVAVETLLHEAAAEGAGHVVIGGMHRGRLNLMANIAGKPLTALLAEVKGASPLPADLDAAGDVPYHLGHDGQREIGGRRLKVSVAPHPSHLEVVAPVALGRCRALQRRAGGRRRVRSLLLHTDASFAGQGVVAETLQLSGLPPFEVGGTVHVVVNNQVGFTTDPEEARTARRCTDIARLIEAPVLHVNADDPEALVRAAVIAARYRARFAADVVIEVVGFRRLGHNEIDEPRFTQPELYRRIDAHPGARCLYARRLRDRGIDTEPAERAAEAFTRELDEALQAAGSYRVNRADWLGGPWSGLRPAGEAEMLAPVATGVAEDRLRALGAALTRLPEEFAAHDKVRRFLAARRESIESGAGLNWATAEALALASLLAEGTPVRLGGQDTPRGAFTQRHLILADQATGARRGVLDHLSDEQAPAEVFSTPLTEYAVVAFEYGHTLADPHTLVLWEAQFGDFLNIAQAVMDQFVVCGEDRWLRMSGLVLLLPHGLDGGGPDHATAHPERLLAGCARGNMQVANPSTPANYFHLLRRQMRRPFRKPLAVLAPKMLLRHRACVSALAEMGEGTGFRPVIGEDSPAKARRVVLCTGKMFYELEAARRDRGLAESVALLRLEQLYPFPADDLAAALAGHPDAELVWCQEEPANMGCHDFVKPRIEAAAGRPLRYAGRPAAPTPATGIAARHQQEQAAVLRAALKA